MTPHAPRTTVRDERGFLLVGVIMFMLALTILGLSLFSLSTYEARFFNDALAREQVLHSSESGAAAVRAHLLVPPQRLENAQRAVGRNGVVRAIAYQWRSGNPSDTTSRGPVDWDSTVAIAVTARLGSEERTTLARFVPVPARTPYQTLLTAGRGVSYNTRNSSARNVEVSGPIQHLVTTSADSAWLNQVLWTSGRPFDVSPAPTVYADAFVDRKLPSASAPSSWDENDLDLGFRNTGTTPVFFRSPPTPESAQEDPEASQFGFYTDGTLTITVRGTCVWVIPDGVCFGRRVVVQPEAGQSGTLVIVAKRNGRAPGFENRGIWFQGGLSLNNPTNTRLFLASSNDIAIGYLRNTTDSRDVRALSVVAGGAIELMGPSGGFRFRLTHPSSMDAVAATLLAQDALPTTSGGNGRVLAYSGASWKETQLP
ncbi:MAG: hypothetical protein ACKO3S_03830 [bacterium]